MNTSAFPAGPIFMITHICSKGLFLQCDEEPPGSLWPGFTLAGLGGEPGRGVIWARDGRGRQAQLLYLRERGKRAQTHEMGGRRPQQGDQRKLVSSLHVALRASLACLLGRHENTVCLGLLLLPDFVPLILRDHSFYPK